MKTLILIDNDYPYKPGGIFIDKEINYLSTVFDNIYVFTIGADTDWDVVFSIPDNVKCFPLNSYSGILKYVVYLLIGLLQAYKYDIPFEKNDGLKQMFSSAYIRGRAFDVATKIWNVIKDHKLEMENVTIYSFWFTYQAIAALVISKLLNSDGISTKVVSRAHGYDLYAERSKTGYLPYQSILLNTLDAVFPCSDFGRAYLLKKYPWAKDKVKVSKLGCADNGIGPYNGERVFVTCSNLQALKRVSLFAKAFSIVAKENRNIRWICIGDGEEYDVIKKIISDGKIEENVSLLGRLHNRDVIELYKHQPIMYFCNISTTEGLPVSIMEAMSFGIPIIATDVGGNSELVDSTNGMLLPADIDEVSLSGYLQHMLELTGNEYKKLRDNSRRKWKNNHYDGKNYSEFCQIIKNNS